VGLSTSVICCSSVSCCKPMASIYCVGQGGTAYTKAFACFDNCSSCV
jgi:hypothetical protein